MKRITNTNLDNTITLAASKSVEELFHAFLAQEEEESFCPDTAKILKDKHLEGEC